MASRRSIVAFLIAATVVTLSAAAPRFSAWSELEAIVATNTTEVEFPGSISKDGLTLYFQRGSLAANGEDLWFVQRRSTDAAWDVPQRLSDSVNSPFNDRAPTISADGHWLFFASDRPGGEGGFDIWASRRRQVHDEFAWDAPINLGAPINTPDFDSGPAFLPRDDGATQLYFTSGRPGGLGATDIYVATWNWDGTFSGPIVIPELSSPARDERPFVRRDGLEIFMQSTRAGSQLFDIWVASRNSIDEAWSAPENLAAINSAGQEITPVVSWDRKQFFFASNRFGNADMFSATRARLRGRR